MLSSIFILFYFLLKFVIAENLKETNFLYQLQNTGDEQRFAQCVENLILNPSNITTKEKKENIICILEETRDNPNKVRNMFIKIKYIIAPFLKQLLNGTDIEYLYDLLNDIFRNNCTFFEDLFDVIEKHPELVNYTIILVKGEIDGKNITQTQIFKIVHEIINIEGMDNVFSHIINSTHNDAILKLIEIKFFNGTKYASFNDTLYPYKNTIIRKMYKILKDGLYILEDEPNKNIILFT